MGSDEKIVCHDCREYHHLGKAGLTLVDHRHIGNEHAIREDRIDGVLAVEAVAFYKDHAGHNVILAPSNQLDHLRYDFTSEHLHDGEEPYTPWLGELDG